MKPRSVWRNSRISKREALFWKLFFIAALLVFTFFFVKV